MEDAEFDFETEYNKGLVEGYEAAMIDPKLTEEIYRALARTPHNRIRSIGFMEGRDKFFSETGQEVKKEGNLKKEPVLEKEENSTKEAERDLRPDRLRRREEPKGFWDAIRDKFSKYKDETPDPSDEVIKPEWDEPEP